jgi:uncharacterized DUF497 family protein
MVRVSRRGEWCITTRGIRLNLRAPLELASTGPPGLAESASSGPPPPVLVYFLYLMDVEFDPAKSVANLKEHGIDFIGAQALWSDPDRLEIPARSLDEPRTQVIGRIGDSVWSAFVTLRGDRIRIISVRRARDEEEEAYLQD